MKISQLQLFDRGGPIVPLSADQATRTVETLTAMRGVARAASESDQVRTLARNWLARNKSDGAFALRTYWYIHNKIRFRRDPDGEELLRDPAKLIETVHDFGLAYGDCDDRAMLGAALLLARGLVPVFIVASRLPRPYPFQHVFYGWRVNGKLYAFDPQTNTPPGEVPPGVLQQGVFDV